MIIEYNILTQSEEIAEARQQEHYACISGNIITIYTGEDIPE